MTAEQSLQHGDVGGALSELQQRIRANPADSGLRVFLFQLLAVTGDWERAGKQLNVLQGMDTSALPLVHTYRDVLLCEAFRADVFAGVRSPLLFGEPQDWMAQLLDANRLFADDEYSAGQDLLGTALEAAPASSGTIDGTAFEWLADADSRLGPVIEAVINGRYFWVPVIRIAKLRFDAPEDLRDAVWYPGYFTWANGGESVGFIPTRYAGSEAHEDDAIRLARRTDWQEPIEGLYFGQGQRQLMTDQGEYPLMDCREIVFNTADTSEDNPSIETPS